MIRSLLATLFLAACFGTTAHAADAPLPPEVQALQAKAAQGDAQAQFDLGAVYAEGKYEVARDYDAAYKWDRKAAEQGLADAENYLGFAYMSGTGIPRDQSEGFRWYLLSANQGNPVAQTTVGTMYYKGDQTPQDYTEAYFWLSLSHDKANDTMRDEAARHIKGTVMKVTNRRINVWKPTAPGKNTVPDNSLE